MKSVDVKRSRVKDRSSRRVRTVEYSVMHATVIYNVCALAFRNIHGLSEKRLRTVRDKVKETGTMERDHRGRQEKIRKIPDSDRARVIEHINSFPALSSHYSRAKSPYGKYLAPDLNISKMYELYCDWLIENYSEDHPVTESFYRNIFNIEFNIGFIPPVQLL